MSRYRFQRKDDIRGSDGHRMVVLTFSSDLSPFYAVVMSRDGTLLDEQESPSKRIAKINHKALCEMYRQ